MNEIEFIKTIVIPELRTFCKSNKLEYILEDIFRLENIFNPTQPRSFWFDSLTRNPAFIGSCNQEKLTLFMNLLKLFNEERKIKIKQYSFFEGNYYRWQLSLNNGIVIDPRVFQDISEIILEENKLKNNDIHIAFILWLIISFVSLFLENNRKALFSLGFYNFLFIYICYLFFKIYSQYQAASLKRKIGNLAQEIEYLKNKNITGTKS